MDYAVRQANTPEHWWVYAQPGQVKYRVHLQVDWVQMPGTVLDTDCTRFEWDGQRWVNAGKCQEWQRELNRLTEALDRGYNPFSVGIKQVDGSPICQHVEAALYAAGVFIPPNQYVLELPPITEMEPVYL